MSDNINIIPAANPTLELSFSWTPSGGFVYTAPSGQVVIGRDASFGLPLVFTANVALNDITGLVTIVEYRWDFGDGIIGYGNPITHTYKVDNFEARTVLRVTDSQGRYWFSRAQMYLANYASYQWVKDNQTTYQALKNNFATYADLADHVI